MATRIRGSMLLGVLFLSVVACFVSPAAAQWPNLQLTSPKAGDVVQAGGECSVQGSGTPPHLLTPNGGEVLDTGSTYTIRWTGPDLPVPCGRLETSLYLCRGDYYYGLIGRFPPACHSFDWTPCRTIEPGEDYTIRLQVDACGVRLTDRSDQPFSIHSSYQPSLTLLSPNGGETLTIGQPVTVRWSAVDLGDEQVNVIFSGSDEQQTVLGSAPASAGELTVGLCSALPDGWDYQLAVTLADCEPVLYDSNDAPFFVANPSPPPPPKITWPVGGEVFTAGSQCLVTWAGPAADPMNGTTFVRLELYKDGQYYWGLSTAIVDSHTVLAGFCSVLEGTGYTIRLVIHDCAGWHEDEMQVPFTITGGKMPSLTLLGPIGGEAFLAGQPMTVRWTSSDLDGTVRVQLRKNGEDYQDLGSAPAAVGQLTGVLCPSTPAGSDYAISVISVYGCGVLEDSSQPPITITGGPSEPVLVVTSPAAGDVLTAGTQQKIAWVASNASGDASVHVWRENQIVDTLSASPAAAGELLWDVCTWDPGDRYRIQLSVTECGRIYEFWSGPFTILAGQEAAPTLTVTSPNGGEVIHGGTREVITWTSTNPRGDVWIYLERNGGEWNTIGTAPMASGRFEWDVCALGDAGDDFTIRINQSQCAWTADDSSDAPFTVTDVGLWPHVTLLSPSFDDVIQAGSATTISWTAESPVGMVTISLWLGDSPVPLMELGEAPMSAGSFTWQVCPLLKTGSEYSIRLRMNQCGRDWYLLESFSFSIAGSGLPAADVDYDCDVDKDDVRQFQACWTGPGILYNLNELPAGCTPILARDGFLPADLDQDGDVDQDDFGLLQRSFTGPGGG